MSLSEKFYKELDLEDYELRSLYEQNKDRDKNMASNTVFQPLCNAVDKFIEEYEGESMLIFDLFLLEEIARRWSRTSQHAFIRGAKYYASIK